ncbi:TetR/AcrR family transcriptional regulator [Corynebacterium casei]|uniref:TetR/AcrR family transcriptional regulator n=1 Tax=Corynebacterium casei TaxID=160386 RepID=UPI003FD483F4
MPKESTDATSIRLSQSVWETVANDGIEATTVRRVAQRAECTTGLLMHHFGSRTAMLTHAREVLYKRTAARADNAERIALTPRDTLFEVLSGTLPLDTERQQEARVWMGFAAAALPDSDIRKLHVSGNHAWLQRIIRLIADCIPTASPSKIRSLAIRLVALTEGLASLSSLDPDTYNTDTQRSILTAEIDALIGTQQT